MESKEKGHVQGDVKNISTKSGANVAKESTSVSICEESSSVHS